MRVLAVVGVFLMAGLMSGCGNNRYLVTSKIVVNSQKEPAAEVVEGAAYKEAPKVVTVALKAPDSCSNRTADQRSGVAVSQETVLKTDCGVEMAEIERAFSRAAYRVISWKDLKFNLENKGDGKSAVQVASALGADVLFQINSLEKSKRTPGKDARWERTYFESNEYGDAVKEQSFDEDTRNFFKNEFLEYYEKSVNLNRQAVTLDATAVLVKNGESMWFYRWTHTDPTAFKYSKTLLVECAKPRLCYPRQPMARPEVKKDSLSPGESEAVSVSEQPEDKEKAVYAELFGNVVSDMVKNFASNRK